MVALGLWQPSYIPLFKLATSIQRSRPPARSCVVQVVFELYDEAVFWQPTESFYNRMATHVPRAAPPSQLTQFHTSFQPDVGKCRRRCCCCSICQLLLLPLLPVACCCAAVGAAACRRCARSTAHCGDCETQRRSQPASQLQSCAFAEYQRIQRARQRLAQIRANVEGTAVQLEAQEAAGADWAGS